MMMVYDNDELLDDLKQFIRATVSQQTAQLDQRLYTVEQQMATKTTLRQLSVVSATDLTSPRSHRRYPNACHRHTRHDTARPRKAHHSAGAAKSIVTSTIDRSSSCSLLRRFEGYADEQHACVRACMTVLIPVSRTPIFAKFDLKSPVSSCGRVIYSINSAGVRQVGTYQGLTIGI
jgi:hypothetical protein